MSKIDVAIEKISSQQKGLTENDRVYWVGEQIKDICRESEAIAELVADDLDNANMSIKNMEKKIEAYARSHGGCTPPQAADKLIRDFYGLPPKGEAPPKPDTPKIINLEDMM